MNTSLVRFLRGLLLVGGLALGVSCNGPQAAVPTSSDGNKNEERPAASSAVSVSTNTSSTPSTAVAAARPVLEPKNMPAGLQDVVKLARGGVNEDVMLAFVQQTTNRFLLGPDELLFLSDIGVPPEVITAMQRKAAPVVGGAPAAAVAEAPMPAVVAAPQPAPAQVVTPDYVQPGPVPGVIAPPATPAPVLVQDPNSSVAFQEVLAPYGVWVDVPGYGRCWQPNYTTLTPGWRPYQHGGRWVWSDFGWYWVSDYPWGWATFHYGRWFSTSGLGWVWAPDTVWGPSWVCWRRTSSHCGWAPLPPGAYFSGGSWFNRGRRVDFEFGFGIGALDFAFLPWGRFCDPSPRHFYASAAHASSLYHQSVVVNNTVLGNNNSVVFQGPGQSAVALASRTPVPQAALRETAWAAASRPAAEQLVQEKTGFVIVSPRVPAGGPAPLAPARGSGRLAPAAGSGSVGRTAPAAALAGDPGVSGAAAAGLGIAAGRAAFDPLVGRASVAIPSTRSPAQSTPQRALASLPSPAPVQLAQPVPPTRSSVTPTPTPASAFAPSASIPIRQAGSGVGGGASFAPSRPATVTPPTSSASIANAPAALPPSRPVYNPAPALSGAVGPVAAPFIPGPPPQSAYHPPAPAYSAANATPFRPAPSAQPQFSAPTRSAPAASAYSAPPSRPAAVSAPSGGGAAKRSGNH
ncbi:MAG: hypothetical protein HY299_00495 [Verrucomicrobia bacterium]|nr:hypothetical protein [Verrucomicrobiota bacterium]